MLLRFNFKNYKSFRDETSLDMTASGHTEHPAHVVKCGGEKLLPVVAIYGANASEKSNVYGAFSFMKEYFMNFFYFGGNGSRRPGVKATPYLFDRVSREKPSNARPAENGSGEP